MAQISALAPYGPVQDAAHQDLHAQGKWKLLEDLDVVRCHQRDRYRDDPKKFLPILDLMKETSIEAFSSTLAILNKQNIHPTCDSIRFFFHQTDVSMVEPFTFKGGFEVPEPDIAVFDHFK